MALPIQGVAAVVKASCGPHHHTMPSVQMSAVEHHHDSDSASHQHDQHEVSEMNAQANMDSAINAADDSPNSNHVHKTSFCSACAACCVGAAAPPSMASLVSPFTKGETVAVPPLVSFTGFFPDSLERPPRHFSA